MRTYICYGRHSFYYIELKDDEDACRHAELVKGTLRVERPGGDVVWPKVEK